SRMVKSFWQKFRILKHENTKTRKHENTWLRLKTQKHENTKTLGFALKHKNTKTRKHENTKTLGFALKHENTKTREHENTRTRKHENTRIRKYDEAMRDFFHKFKNLNFKYKEQIGKPAFLNKFKNLYLKYKNKKGEINKRLEQSELIEERHPEQPRKLFLRPILYFAAILFILILPFKAFVYYKSLSIADLRGKVVGASEAAISELFQAGKTVSEFDFTQASASFSSAGNNFLTAQNELNEISGFLFVLAGLAPNDELKLASCAKDILAAGETASNLGISLSMAMESLISWEDDVLDEFEKNARQAIGYARDLGGILKNIDAENLPKEYQEQFLLMQEKSEFLEESLNGFSNLLSGIKIFAGVDQDKRYLLVFQNNTEMRASGGFIGSYALVDFKNGKIKNIEAPGGGSYDTEAGLYARVAAPKPLHLVSPLWHFWDANWWPDWPKSAKKLMWFYEKSDGPTVDGVISFTPTVIEGILEAIGPIDMAEKYGAVISADNFWLTVQAIAEEKPEPGLLVAASADNRQEEEKHAPKKIIGDLLEAILAELPNRLDKESIVNLIKVLEKNLNEKHILFYFADNELQEKVEEYGWDGKIKQSLKDYLAVINTNIAGGKSDKKIKETINHSAEITQDGSIISTVTIKREHTGVKNEPFSGVRNVNWMRVYVPLGSELMEARGFEQPDEIYFEHPDSSWLSDPDLYREEYEHQIHLPSNTKIYEESWKTVFANWTTVDPGETDVVYLKYKLPFKLEKKDNNNIIEKIKSYFSASQEPLYPYSILIQKQSGSLASFINSSLTLDDNFKIVWKYPEELSADSNGWNINSDLSVDRYWAVMMEKE
ncbi:DUF4012 domain-containing protein, partial [Patescibacteria group bacterium]|nr:DUF4012 domain-containing protein [Patescibacteria group bacterium]